MDSNKLIEENAMDIARQKIIISINEKIKKYEETKDNQLKLEIIELIKDRDLVYSNDEKTIKKYL